MKDDGSVLEGFELFELTFKNSRGERKKALYVVYSNRLRQNQIDYMIIDAYADIRWMACTTA